MAAGDRMLIQTTTSVDITSEARMRMVEMVGRYLKEFALNELKAHAIPYAGNMFCKGAVTLEHNIVIGRLFFYYLKKDQRIDLFKEVYRFTRNGWVKIEEWNWDPKKREGKGDFVLSWGVERFDEPIRGEWVCLPPPRLDPLPDRPAGAS